MIDLDNIMHPEDLKTVWTCQECESHFVFHADVDDHIQQTGHYKIRKNDLLPHNAMDVDI